MSTWRADCFRIGAENLQHSRYVAVTDQPEQQMRCSDVLGVTRIGFVMGLRHDAPRTVAELIKHPPPPLLPRCCRQSSRCSRNWPLTPPLTALRRSDDGWMLEVLSDVACYRRAGPLERFHSGAKANPMPRRVDAMRPSANAPARVP